MTHLLSLEIQLQVDTYYSLSAVCVGGKVFVNILAVAASSGQYTVCRAVYIFTCFGVILLYCLLQAELCTFCGGDLTPSN